MANWLTICSIEDLQPNSGICALVIDQQVAIFWILPSPFADTDGKFVGEVLAVGNYDPLGKANVLSRGIVGDSQGRPVVASPLYKHHFNLQTGICLENDRIRIPVYSIRVNDTQVQIDISVMPDKGVIA